MRQIIYVVILFFIIPNSVYSQSIPDIEKLLEANDIERGFKLGVATGSASAFSEGLATKDYVYELLNQIN